MRPGEPQLRPSLKFRRSEAFAGTTATVTVTAHAGVARGCGTAHDAALITESAPATVTGESMAHAAIVIFSEPTEDGVFFAQVQRNDGKVLACGYGDSHIDALLDLIPALLPPDHPEHETLAEQPDDLI